MVHPSSGESEGRAFGGADAAPALGFGVLLRPHFAKNAPAPAYSFEASTDFSFRFFLLIDEATAAVVIVSSLSRSKGIARQSSPTTEQCTEIKRDGPYAWAMAT